MSQKISQSNIQKPIVNIELKTTMKTPVKSSRRRRNNKTTKLNNTSNSGNTTRTSIIEKKRLNEELTQDPAEYNEEKATKKMCTATIISEPTNLSMPLIKPANLKNVEESMRKKPDVGISSNTQETLPRQIDFDLRPCYKVNSKFYNHESGRVNNCVGDNFTSGNNLYTKNIRAEQYHINNRNLINDGYLRERRQHYSFNDANVNKNTLSSQKNHFGFNRQTENSGSYKNSRYYNTNNAGSRDNGRYNNNTFGFRRNNVPELETIHTNYKQRTAIHYSQQENCIVELNTCVNAWVPSCKDSKKSTETNEAEIEEIQKKVRSILNKITPETMIVLTKSIIDMPITTYNSLSKIIELLFQKAIDEPNFTPQYAYICSQMKDIQVMANDGKTKTSFQRLIVLKCQETFELVSALEKKAMKNLSEIKSCKDQVLKKELKCKYEENERIQRKRSVGNCRFMCELFKVKLLNSNILEKCVRHLLKFSKEEPLECLCNILKHIGQYLNPDNTFEKLREISSKSYKIKISSRIRFMILDTIDLKNNNWVPRNVVIKPKTLNEIEEEFTMVSSNDRTIAAYTQPVVRPLEHFLYSNTQKNKINEQKTINTNPKSQKIEADFLTKYSEVELNTYKNVRVPRFQNVQKSTTTSEVNFDEIEKNVLELPKPVKSVEMMTGKKQDKIYEKNTINSNFKKKIEPESIIKNNEIEIKTNKNPWLPRYWNPLHAPSIRRVKIEEIEIKIPEFLKPDKFLKDMTNNEQNEINEQKTMCNPESKEKEPESVVKNNVVELNTCKNPWVPRFRNSTNSTVTSKEIEEKVQELPNAEITTKVITANGQDKINEKNTINSNLESKTESESVTKNNEVELKTNKNPWCPQYWNPLNAPGTRK